MKYLKKILFVVTAIMLVVLLCCLPSVLACEHENTSLETCVNATCFSNGMNREVCDDCGAVLDEIVVTAYGHSFGEYIPVREPILGNDGVEMRVCNRCERAEYRNFKCVHSSFSETILSEPTCIIKGVVERVCNTCGSIWNDEIETLPHAEVYSTVIRDSSCYEEGAEIDICKACGCVAEERALEKVDCSYGEWVYTMYATPFEEGSRYHICTVCGNKDVENYSFEMENNTLYIPSVGIYCGLYNGAFTQGDVDSHDVVYTTGAYGVRDEQNPFILGHWYGSLIDMHEIKIGERIYVCINGQVDTYEALVSEYAVEMIQTYHIGQSSGVNIWDTYGSAMNSQVAWYGRNHCGVDRWEDINDGKTLHMYTCHYGSGKSEWLPEHGGRGRWIVLGNLIDSRPLN